MTNNIIKNRDDKNFIIMKLYKFAFLTSNYENVSLQRYLST